MLDCGENIFEAAFLGLCQSSPGKNKILLKLPSLLRDLTPSQHCKAFYGARRHSNSGQSKQPRRKSDLRMFHPMSRPDASLGTASPSSAGTSSVSCQWSRDRQRVVSEERETVRSPDSIAATGTAGWAAEAAAAVSAWNEFQRKESRNETQREERRVGRKKKVKVVRFFVVGKNDLLWWKTCEQYERCKGREKS